MFYFHFIKRIIWERSTFMLHWLDEIREMRYLENQYKISLSEWSRWISLISESFIVFRSRIIWIFCYNLQIESAFLFAPKNNWKYARTNFVDFKLSICWRNCVENHKIIYRTSLNIESVFFHYNLWIILEYTRMKNFLNNFGDEKN